MTPARALGLLALTAAALLAVPGGARAQDSTAARVRQRLERLARPPAPDTVSAVGEDTVVIVGRGGGAPAAMAASGDTLLQALLALEGYEPTRYEGTGAVFEADRRVLLLLGDSASRAVVRREGMELTADSVIRFDEASGMISADGSPVFSPQGGDPVESGRIVYDLNRSRGSATSARTRYSSGANWIVTGDLPEVSPDVVYGSHTRFTSCELEVPHYHFETDEIKIVAGKILVARPVRLYFADVPVAWLPFVAQSLATGRSSGLLAPTFSVNDIVRTSGGYNRRISNLGFYWAMSDYTDATVAMDWFDNNYTAVTGSFRYRWVRQFLDGTVNARQYWKAEGGAERALDTQHSWRPDERTNMNASVRYSSSNDFVRRNSFDPREVTQAITSSGGIDRRFDWGSVILGATRNEYLSDDRVAQTLPDFSLNLSPLTLFGAPAARASWFNNLTWSGRMSARRTTEDFSDDPSDTTITRVRLDTQGLSGSVSSTFSLGNLSWAQQASLRRASTFSVPVFPGDPDSGVLGWSPRGALLMAPGASVAALVEGDVRDVNQDDLSWSTSLSYQQTLVGSTTLTPRIQLSGNALRGDTLALARSFVSAPSRMSFGAALKSDIYGFFGGFGPFEAIRHKISPELRYDWSPETTPNELQRTVFGSRVLQPTNELGLTVNNTFEAKRRQDDSGDGAADSVTTAELEAAARPDSAAALEPGAPGAPTPQAPAGAAEPRRQERAQIVNLLSIRTSAVNYDFVEADSTGDFLQGFTVTSLTNSISSDFLRGLTVTVGHDLFRDSVISAEGAGRDRIVRDFAPHLSRLNLGFSVNNNSAIARGFGLFGERDEAASPQEDDPGPDPFASRGALDETRVIPGDEDDRQESVAPPPDRQPGDVGRWSANFSYALQRPRAVARPAGARTNTASQMLQVSFNLIPTAQWDLGWRTSYDLERGAFNDHSVNLTRDLHRWQATFRFSKTALGNWTFDFQVSLLDNRDLKFDYKQRNIDTGDRRTTTP